MMNHVVDVRPITEFVAGLPSLHQAEMKTGDKSTLEMNYSVSQKNPPPDFFLRFFPNGWEFYPNFHTPILSSYLRCSTNFYSIRPTYTTLIQHIKRVRDHHYA